MAKRKTKAQRQSEQHRALWNRVYDLASGACGMPFDQEYGKEAEQWMTAADLGRLVPVLRALFSGEADDGGYTPYGYLFEAGNLEHFDDVGSITDFMFDRGIRA